LFKTVGVAWCCCAVAQERVVETIPFLPSASDAVREGLVRIVNRSPEAGELRIVATDDQGRKYDPLTLAMQGHGSVQFTVGDLESGNSEVGLRGGTGPGQGDWRLDVSGAMEFEALAYVRDADGFLTSMNAVAPLEDGTHRVATFNPGRNGRQVSMLRLVNPGDADARVTVAGTDDSGERRGAVTIAIPSGEARTFRSDRLESGGPGLEGALGVGTGKWRLAIDSEEALLVMSLLSNPTGHLTNLSGRPDNARPGGVHRIGFLPAASGDSQRVGFVRVINRTARHGEAMLTARDESTWEYDPLVLALAGNRARHFNSHDLEQGNRLKGLATGVGSGDGDWRLAVSGELDMTVRAYIRTDLGFVTTMYETAVESPDEPHHYYLPLFLPASYAGQRSRLRLRNEGESEADIRIEALDDRGARDAGSGVRFKLGPGMMRELTSAELEAGGDGLCGRIGDGSGIWRLFVSADRRLDVMGLGYGGAGRLENLSRGRVGYYAWPLADPVPDLVPTGLSANANRVLTGEAFTLSGNVVNEGDGVSVPTVLRCYRSLDAEVSPADVEACSYRVGCLERDSSSGFSASLNAPFEAGTFHYGVCVDPHADEDTTNNCSSAVRIVVQGRGEPDLVVESASVSDSDPLANGTFVLSATVRNRGDVAAAATTLRYYRSADATITRSDTAVGTDAVVALGSSGTSTEEIEVTAPSNAGRYHYGACVDAVADEADTANNCSAGVAVTVGTGPDLTVDAPTASDAEPLRGGTFTLSTTVRNRGDRAAAATTLRYYRSADSTITREDAAAGTAAVAALAASGADGKEIVLTAPASVGTYHYGACVDAVAEEEDTTNNCSAAVAVTVRAGPDLLVETPSVDEASAAPNTKFTLSATVRNQGDAQASATTLRYYRSADATLTRSDTAVGTDAVAALAASRTGAEQIEVKAPSTTGTYHYGACVDAVADETDTMNNCSATVSVTVREGPDLRVDSPSASESSVLRGGTFTLSTTVRNDGGTAASASTVRYYRSADATITREDASVGTDEVPALEASDTVGREIEITAPTTAGTYHYGACVDAVADEADTTNNCSAAVAVTVRTGPDLTVDRPSVSDSEPLRGGTFRLSTTVRNRGEVASSATRLYYYRSIDARITRSDARVGTDEVAALAVAAAGAEEIDLTAPLGLATYYYGACVDAVANELDTSNNCSASVAVRVRAGPDLVVVSPSVNESELLASGSFTLSAVVRNRGDVAAPATTLRYYRSSDRTITRSDTAVGTDAVAALRRSGVRGESIDLSAPAARGTYYYGACVDAVTGESNRGNNCSAAVAVNVREGPDLVVDAPLPSRAGVPPTRSFTLSTTVRNGGDAPAAATTLRYYRSTDATITDADTAVGTDQVKALSASGTSAEEIELVAPSTEGTYHYGACVDGVANETDTTNNCSTGAAVTVATGPDLTVDRPSATATAPLMIGDTFTLDVTVRNQGNDDSTATTLRYYQSSDATITASDTDLGTAEVTMLTASGSVDGQIEVTAPSSGGTWYYGACVDAVASELDTMNNCSRALSLYVHRGPDLWIVVHAGSVEHCPRTPGHPFVRFRYGNRGDVEVADAGWDIYESTDATITTDDNRLGGDATGRLPPNTTSLQLKCLPLRNEAGTVYYGACMRAVQREFDTTNNCTPNPFKIDWVN